MHSTSHWMRTLVVVHSGPIQMACGSCLSRKHTINSVIGVSRPLVPGCGMISTWTTAVGTVSGLFQTICGNLSLVTEVPGDSLNLYALYKYTYLSSCEESVSVFCMNLFTLNKVIHGKTIQPQVIVVWRRHVDDVWLVFFPVRLKLHETLKCGCRAVVYHCVDVIRMASRLWRWLLKKGSSRSPICCWNTMHTSICLIGYYIAFCYVASVFNTELVAFDRIQSFRKYFFVTSVSVV